jgi:hypothetical protein
MKINTSQTIGKFVFAFLLWSSSVSAYEQQYQPGDTGPNGGTITSVTVTSVDSDPVTTTSGDQQTTTVETTFTETIIEATTNQVVTTEMVDTEVRQISGTNTTGNIIDDVPYTFSGDGVDYGSGTIIFGAEGEVTSEILLRNYMDEEQWQAGFQIDSQAEMINCFNTSTGYFDNSTCASASGPADTFTMKITVTDGSESYSSTTTHTIDNGPFQFETYSMTMNVPSNNMDNDIKAIFEGTGKDSAGHSGNYGPYIRNPEVTITHNVYETIIQQIEQQITNTVTEYITTTLTDTESASTTTTIQDNSGGGGDSGGGGSDSGGGNDSDSESNNQDVVIVIVDDNSNDNNSNNDSSNETGDAAVEDDHVQEDTVVEIIEDTVVEVIEDTVVDTVEVVNDTIEIILEEPKHKHDEHVTEVEVQKIEESKKIKITQDHIDNMLDTVQVAVSDNMGDIVNISVDVTVDSAGTVQVEIANIDMPGPMNDMPGPMTETVTVNDMNMQPPAMEPPSMDQMPEMSDISPQGPETTLNIASNTNGPNASAPVDMPAMNAGPRDMQSAVSEAVSEMANLDAAPMDTPGPGPGPNEPTDSPQSGDIVVGESNDSPASMETEAGPQQTTEAQPQSESRPEPQAEPEPQSQSEPEPNSEPESQQQESEPEQTAEAQPQQESEPEQQSEPQEQESTSNESKDDSKDSEQKTEQKAESKQTKTKTAEQKKQEMKQKIAQKILTRVLQNQNVTMSQVDATRLTLMTSLADTAGFNSYQSAILSDRNTWYTDTKIYDLPQMVDPFADILTGAQNMQMDSLIDSQYGG